MLNLKKATASEGYLRRFSGDSVGIRTQDPQLRRLLLYPAELRNRALSQTNKENTVFFVFNWNNVKRNSFIFHVIPIESSKRKLTLSWRGEVNEVNRKVNGVNRKVNGVNRAFCGCKNSVIFLHFKPLFPIFATTAK